MKTPSDSDLKFGSALLIAGLGFGISAGLVCFLVFKAKDWEPAEVTALVSIFTGATGTIVGAFLGLQIGSQGKEENQNLAHRALAALPPETAERILRNEN